MAYERQARVTERLTADGTVNGGRPVRKLLSVGQLSGAAAASTVWYNNTSAVAADKKGGVTSGAAATWAWVTAHEQEFPVALFFDLDNTNTAEVIAVYIP